MSLFPSDYRDPSSGSNYMKLEDGSSKFRVLSEPVMGWLYWVEKDGKRKPVRVRDFKEVPQEFRAPADSKMKAKYFWAMLVWNYNDSRAQVLEITQATIRNAMLALDQDSDWGDARGYDIAITKSGKGMETEYHATPKNKAVFDKSDKNIPVIDLQALFKGEDPFTGALDENIEKAAEVIFDGELGLSEKSNS